MKNKRILAVGDFEEIEVYECVGCEESPKLIEIITKMTPESSRDYLRFSYPTHAPINLFYRTYNKKEKVK